MEYWEIDKPVEIRAFANPAYRAIDIYIGTPQYEGTVVFEPRGPINGTASRVSLQIKEQEAQVLMDYLWRCGMRPTEGHATAGQAAAMFAHLADLQKLAFGAQEVLLEGAREFNKLRTMVIHSDSNRPPHFLGEST